MTKNQQIKAPSIIPNRVEFFNKLSNVWWNKGARVRPVFFALNKVIASYIQQRLLKEKLAKKPLANTSPTLENLHILDVGCGGGLISEPLAKGGATLVGIDVGSQLIETAKQHAKEESLEHKLTYHLESVEDHCVNNIEKYDAVVLSQVLMHVQNKDIVLNSCIKCLKPGGSIFVVAVNKTWSVWFYYIILGEIVLRFLYRNLTVWENLIKSTQVKEMLLKSGCKIEDTRGLNYNFLTKKWNFKNHDWFIFIYHAIKK